MTEQAAPQCYRHPGRQTWITCQRCGRPICPDCMVPASVGFQCPGCVNEGRKTIRAPRTVFGGRISLQPSQTTLAIIAINAVLWLLTAVTGGNGSKLVQYLAITPKGTCVLNGGTLWYPGATQATCPSGAHWIAGATDGAPWQFLTSAFMHVEPAHIALNMISLWFLGPPLEALLGALLILSRRTPALFQQVTMWLIINLVFTFTVSGISWQGHIGGLLGGALVTVGIVALNQHRRSATLR